MDTHKAPDMSTRTVRPLVAAGLKIADALGESWRIGPGTEFMDALQAAQESLEYEDAEYTRLCNDRD